jgi:hypothetical protein
LAILGMQPDSGLFPGHSCHGKTDACRQYGCPQEVPPEPDCPCRADGPMQNLHTNSPAVVCIQL